jgi:hypothetical protein
MSYTVTRQFVQLVQDDGDFDVRVDYSGRGMYGRKCFGIVGYPSDLAHFLTRLPLYLAEDEGEPVINVVNDVVDEWMQLSWDSMGQQTIFYWPSVQVLDEEQEDIMDVMAMGPPDNDTQGA